MADKPEHRIHAVPQPDNDGLYTWTCTCGVWAQDHSRDESQETADAHLDETAATATER